MIGDDRDMSHAIGPSKATRISDVPPPGRQATVARPSALSTLLVPVVRYETRDVGDYALNWRPIPDASRARKSDQSSS